MKYLLPLFAATFVLTALTLFLFQKIQPTNAPQLSNSDLDALMLREAQLIDHFCLSRIPPIIGPASVPREWQTALNSDIRLTDQIGEIVGSSPELTKLADNIRGLEAGKAVSAIDGQSPPMARLVYRPKQGGSSYLIITKPAEQRSIAQADPPKMNWTLILGLSVANALAVVLISRLFIKQT